MFRHIGHKIILVVGIAAALGLLGLAYFYTVNQEQSILAQNERTMHKLTESIGQGLQTVMLAGYANVAQEYADRLKQVPDVDDFRILRTNGDEAFRDNKTINEVNLRLGDEEFIPRRQEQRIAVVAEQHPELRRTIADQRVIPFYETSSTGERSLTFLAPILNDEGCHECHSSDHEIRGIIKLTTSLSPIEQDIRETWQSSSLVVATAIALTILVTGLMIRRSVVAPIDSVMRAMLRAARGDLTQEVPVLGQDELSQMAGSFNRMSQQLLKSYVGLQNEQDKLSTIILSAREGIVVTDGEGQIVLINPAAEQLLGKSVDAIVGNGFLNLFDEPERMQCSLENSGGEGEAELLDYNDRILSVYASTIHTNDGSIVGSAALIRDVTEEKRLERELIRLSTTDGLTGLYNRRYLDDTLRAELSRALRYSNPLSLLMFDVDHFKRFNDEHGHEQGDRVLQAIAQQMRLCTRQVDHVCRYGGEEFAIILPNTPETGAVRVAERLRTSIEAMEVDKLKVTISIGVVATPPLMTTDPEELMKAADKALYVGKENGRNQVQVAVRSTG